METILRHLYKSNNFPLKFAAALLTLSVKIRAVPFNLKYEKNDNKGLTCHFEKLNNDWDICVWRLISGGTFLYSIFLCVDLYLYYPTYLEENQILELLLALVWATSFIVISTFRIHFILRYNEIVLTMNSVLSLNIIIKDGSSEFIKVWRTIDLVALILWMDAIFGVTFTSVMFWFFPTHRRYIYAFFPESWQTIWIKIIMFIYESFFISLQWGGFVTTFIINILYMETLKTSLSLMNRADVSKAIGYYPIIRVIDRIHYLGFGKLGLPSLKLVFSITAVLSFAIAIKLGGKVNPVVIYILYVIAASTVGFLWVILPIAGSIHQRSIECITHFKTCVNFKDKESIARVKCCPPIGIRIASYYIIQRGTVLACLSIMLGNLANILVYLKDY